MLSFRALIKFAISLATYSLADEALSNTNVGRRSLLVSTSGACSNPCDMHSDSQQERKPVGYATSELLVLCLKKLFVLFLLSIMH